MPLAFIGTKAHCWLLVNLSTRIPRSFFFFFSSFSYRAAFQPASPQPFMVLFHPNAGFCIHLCWTSRWTVSLFLQPVQIHLNGSPGLQCIKLKVSNAFLKTGIRVHCFLYLINLKLIQSWKSCFHTCLSSCLKLFNNRIVTETHLVYTDISPLSSTSSSGMSLQ